MSKMAKLLYKALSKIMRKQRRKLENIFKMIYINNNKN